MDGLNKENNITGRQPLLLKGKKYPVQTCRFQIEFNDLVRSAAVKLCIFDRLLNADFDDCTGLSGSQKHGQGKGIYGKDD
jgi:hypothetical protein